MTSIHLPEDAAMARKSRRLNVAIWALAGLGGLGSLMAFGAATADHVNHRVLIAQGTPVPPAIHDNTIGVAQGGLLVGAAAVVTALVPVLLRVVQAWQVTYLAKEQYVTKQAEANEKIQANTKRIGTLEDRLTRHREMLRQMAEVIKIDRDWMLQVAKEAGLKLPDGFGARTFDGAGWTSLYHDEPGMADEDDRLKF